METIQENKYNIKTGDIFSYEGPKGNTWYKEIVKVSEKSVFWRYTNSPIIKPYRESLSVFNNLLDRYCSNHPNKPQDKMRTGKLIEEVLFDVADLESADWKEFCTIGHSAMIKDTKGDGHFVARFKSSMTGNYMYELG